MTDAELSRQEWIEERAAILEFCSGITRLQAELEARRLWEQHVRRWNAPASHGDGPGAHDGCTDSHA